MTLAGFKIQAPGQMPDLRLYLRNNWLPGKTFHAVTTMMADQGLFSHKNHKADPNAYAAWQQNALERAELFWISAEMLDVVEALAPSVPANTQVEDLIPPAPAGLVCFERPWLGMDSVDAKPIEVDAFVWANARLPYLPELGASGGHRALSLSAYEKYRPTEYSEPSTWWSQDSWIPIGRSDWPVQTNIGVEPYPEMEEFIKASFVEDRRFIAAFWTLLQQNAIAQTRIVSAARAVARRSQRAGIDTSKNVKIVTLRRLERSEHEKTVLSQKREHDHRWLVSGHWRHQPFGPGRKQRRLQYISPHIKGPDDKPLKTKTRVNAWVR